MQRQDATGRVENISIFKHFVLPFVFAEYQLPPISKRGNTIVRQSLEVRKEITLDANVQQLLEY